MPCRQPPSPLPQGHQAAATLSAQITYICACQGNAGALQSAAHRRFERIEGL